MPLKGKERRRQKKTKQREKKEKNHRRRRRRHNITLEQKTIGAQQIWPQQQRKDLRKIQSFVVDCTRPVRIDCVARIVVASKSDDDFLFCGEGSPHHRTNVVKNCARFRVVLPRRMRSIN